MSDLALNLLAIVGGAIAILAIGLVVLWLAARTKLDD